MTFIYHRNRKRPEIVKENNHYYLKGDWTRDNVSRLQHKVHRLRFATGGELIIDAHELSSLDTAGALIIFSMLNTLKKRSIPYTLVGFKSEHEALMDLLTSKETTLTDQPPLPKRKSFFEAVGKATVNKFLQIYQYLNFFGQFTLMSFHSVRHFSALQLRTFLNSINEMGFQALPIIALLSFLVGVVIAYQLGVELQDYGANIFIANLIGQAILREFAPLITAIIGAGRTSAALTAQIGAMKINSEIDALRTMGFSPFDILVIPRVIASLIAFPLLMLWADIFGVIGGMIMTKALFGMSYGEFLGRFNDAINPPILWVGLSKAPAFALIISIVGCFHGLNVTTHADSIGTQTTKSVVQAIFLIIIADAVYSIIYSKLNI